ncbi:MAG TPA: kelch repeat-containing protein, partial [Polyangia bacterium]|nr:kelch repeat-containing protein [Polyangia bacterium]
MLLATACSSRPDAKGESVETVRSALVDGGAPASGANEYSVFVAGPTPGAGRMKPAMVFDSKNRVSLVFGGYALGGALAETWEYDGAWTQRCTGDSCQGTPAARHAAPLAYVPDRSVAVLYGGSTGAGALLCDTWEWASDGRTWTSKSAPTCSDASVTSRTAHSMAGFGSKAVAFGGLVSTGGGAPLRTNDISAWDGQNWSSLCDKDCAGDPLPAPRAYSSLVHAHLSRGDVLWVFGGNALPAGSDTGQLVSDLWEFDVATSRWTERCTSAACKASAPAARAEHGAAFDSVRGRLFVQGGCRNAACSGAAFDDAYEYDPGADLWSSVPRVVGAGLPQGRADLAAVFDGARGRVV